MSGSEEFIYYYQFDGDTFGVYTEGQTKVRVKRLSDGRVMKVSKDWVQKNLESGKLDVSTSRGNFD